MKLLPPPSTHMHKEGAEKSPAYFYLECVGLSDIRHYFNYIGAVQFMTCFNFLVTTVMNYHKLGG
jgi:hypothetical protein